MASSLTDLLLPVTTPANLIMADLSVIQTQVSGLRGPIDPKGSNATSALIQHDSAAVDFSGLGAQAFQESLKVHLEVTGHITDAFQGVYKALSALTTTLDSSNLQYDSRLGTIRATNYAPNNPSDPVSQGARGAFIALNPWTAMIDNVIAAADGNAVLQGGGSDLADLLSGVYTRLVNSASGEHITFPFGQVPTPAEESQARQMVIDALYELYYDVNLAYYQWGDAVQLAFSTFTSAMSSLEQQVQPFIEILTQPTSAASIFDMIQMLSQTDQPIAIVQTGPNSILVMISGTNASQMSFDTNLWNALGTGMGQDMPYEQDVMAAIQQYCQEHGLTNPDVTLAGHSLGGMVAQQIASSRLFNVKEVVTYGSPTMGDPVPGIQYDLYEAQGDPVPLLSRYENPSLPSSYQDLAKMYPNFQTNYESPFHNPFSLSGLTHDVSAVGRDIGATWDNAFSAAKNLGGVGYLYLEASLAANYVPLKIGSVPVGPILNGLNGNPLGDLTEGIPSAKLAYMDPHHLYGNSIKLVPDLTDMSPGVHSEYGQSVWLENTQKIYAPPDVSQGSFLSNTEYFGMSNEYQTAQINQYMHDHSSLGQLLSLVNSH